jgi:RimJ/RimL family protein N-acetyltransferase
MFIRSERLFLRPSWPEDAQDLQGAIAHEAVVRNLARAPWPYTHDHAREFVSRPQDHRLPNFLVTLPGAGGSQIIGGVGLHGDGASVELGYWLTPEAWGRGYATEAASAVLRLARTLGHRRIGAYHFLDNPGSGRVLEKLGFRSTSFVSERPSLGRGGSFPSRRYVLQFDQDLCGSDEIEDVAVPDMRAA